MSLTLPAVTIWPEWLFGILYFGKDIENREGWPFSILQSLVGKWLALHGGKNIAGRPLLKGDKLSEHHVAAIREVMAIEKMLRAPGADEPARLTKRFSANDILREARGIAALAYVGGLCIGDPRGWFMGRPGVGIHFTKVVRLTEPVPCDGKQMLWPVPQELVRPITNNLPDDAPEDLRRILREAA